MRAGKVMSRFPCPHCEHDTLHVSTRCNECGKEHVWANDGYVAGYNPHLNQDAKRERDKQVRRARESAIRNKLHGYSRRSTP